MSNGNSLVNAGFLIDFYWSNNIYNIEKLQILVNIQRLQIVLIFKYVNKLDE